MGFDVAEYSRKRKEEEEEKYKVKSNDTSGGFDVAEYSKIRSVPSVLENFQTSLKNWFESGNNLVSTYNSRYFDEEGNFVNNKYRGDYADYYESTRKTVSSLKDEQYRLLGILDEYGDYFDFGDSSVDEIKSSIASSYDGIRNIFVSSSKDYDYWSQWETEDDYNQWVSANEEYEKQKSYDLDAGQEEINRLEAILSEAKGYKSKASAAENRNKTYQGRGGMNAPGGTGDASQYTEQLANFLKENGYSSVDEIEKDISNKRLYHNNAKRIQEGVRLSGVADPESEFYDPEFEKYSGYASTKSDAWHAGLTTDLGMGYKDLAYEYINDVDGIRSKINNKALTYRTEEALYHEKGYDHLTEQEVAIYNYYYAKDGKEAAEKYLDSIQETLNHRKATKDFTRLEDNTFAEILFGVHAGVNQFADGIKNLFNTDDYIPSSAVQMASQMVREDLSDDGWKLPDFLGGSSLGQVAYDVTNTTSNMLPSILVGAVTHPYVGSALLGASAAGNAYQEMLNLGYDKGQARFYSTLVGASEATLESLLGGISALGGKATGGLVTKLVSKVDNAFARAAIRFGGSMLSEGFEEGLQEYLDPWFKSIALNTDYEAANLDEILYSGLLGALSAFGLEGTNIVSSEVSTYSQGKNLKNSSKVDRLVELGKTFSADTVAYQIASKVNKDTGAYTIGRLLNEVGASLSEKNISDITNALVERHMDQSHAKINAEWMAKVVNGATLTKRQQAALENNPVLADVLYGTIIQPNSTVMQRNQDFAKLNGEEISMGIDRNALEESQTPEAISKAITQRLASEQAIGEALVRGADSRRGLSTEQLSEIDDFVAKTRTTIPESNYQDVGQSVSSKPSSAKIANIDGRVTDTGATFVKSTGEEVSIEKIASIDAKNKTMKLELSNGDVVDSKDISYGDETQGLLYESVLLMGYDVSTANAIVQGYTASSPTSVEDYLIGTNEAFNYGWGHISEKARGGTGYKKLTNAEIAYAVKLGEDARASDDSVRETNVSQKQASATKKKAKGGYGARLSVDKKAVTDRVKESVKALDEVGKALKLNIVIADLGGNAYGFYRSSTNELILDVNAGGNGKHTLLFTASHELIHYIRNWSPDKFTVLADFLMEQYAAKGENIDELIRAEIDKAYKATRGKHEMTFDEAYEEVVAQAMQRFLTDSNFIEHLASLQKKDANLAKRLVSKLKEILNNIRAAYQGMEANDRASQAVKEMGEAIDELYAKMEEGLVAASEASQSIGARNLEDFSEAKNTNGEDLFQYKAMEADEETYRQMLKKHGIMSEQDINKLFSTIDKALVIIKNNLEVLDYAWEADIDDRSFSPVKPNSDNLYKVSLDFSTLCRKRILQQVIQTQLQDALKKPLSREESIAIRDELMKIQEEGRQIEIACALCYVESARMKSPAQIKKFLKNREAVIKEFLASKAGGDIKQKIAQAETAVREELHKENPDGVMGKGGTLVDPRSAKLNQMSKKYADEIRAAKKEAKKAYTPTEEEQKLIDTALSMSVTDFTSPEGLGNLAKNYPVLFDAYTSYIRNATKSKGIEKDTWWRAGDSNSIGDTLIANMNRENGLRSQSWSDFQVIHLLDYIAATIELSTRNAKEQAYSKVPDYIELMGNTGVMLNMSLIPTAQFNGTLEYDSVEGMAYKKALELRDKYHATAGTICIGISNEQIKMLLDDSTIDYVIPYHKSGMAAHIRKLMHIPTWSEYEDYQSETNLSRDEAMKQAKMYGVALLSESDPNYHKHTAFSEWFDIEEARQIAKQENAFPTDAKLQKKLGVMYGGYMAMRNAANNYIKLCVERGIAPKFSHENANFAAEANYWKLIIDRKMVDNVTGEIIEQQAIKPIFDEGEVLRILNDELERYPGIKADQDYATRAVVEKFLSGKMNDRLDPDTVAAIMQKPVDNITTTNIVASATEIKEFDSSEEKIASNIQEIAKMHSVYDVDKSKLEKTGKRPSEIFEEHFKSWGYRLHSDELGDIKAEKPSVKSEIRHGLTAEKIASIEAIPAVIKEGKVIFSGTKPNSDVQRIVVCAPIKIGNTPYYMGVMLQRDSQTQRLYLHNVAIEKEASNISQVDLLTTGTDENNEYLFVTSILQNALNVKYRNRGSVKTNQNISVTDNPELDDVSHQYIDSEGNTLSKEQQEFFKYSKVRDGQGRLLVCYHGTNTEFNTFSNIQTEPGYWFTEEKDYAVSHGDIVLNVYLDIRNPFDIDDFKLTDIHYEQFFKGRDFDEKLILSNEFRDYLVGSGFDGMMWEHSGYKTVIAFEPNQIKSVANTTPTSDPDIRFQYIDEDSIDSRTLLAKALEGAAKTDIEKQKLKEYQAKIALINSEEAKLRELREQIREISFSKGKRDTEKLKSLQFEANQAANRINVYDKQLLKLEATKPLRDILAREKEMARKRQKQKDMQLLAEYREKSKATVRELMQRNQESRKKAIERREMALVRNKIKAFKTKLESSLLRPTDRSYVPFGLVQAVVDVCDIINTDTDLYKEDGTINKAQERRNLTKEKLQALKDEYEKLKDYDDPVYSGEFDDAIYYMLKDLRERYDGRSLSDMNLGELSDMYDILRSIGDTLADARKLIGKGEAYDVYEAGDAIIREQGEVAQKRKKGKRSGPQKAKDAVINLSLSPVRNVERMSGYKEGSVLVDLFNDFEIGVRQKNRFEMEAKKSFEAITTGENSKAYESAVYDAFKEYVDDSGRKFGISKMQMMQAILSHDRERANRMHHIEGGGLVFADLDMLRKGSLNDAISSENSHLVSNAENLIEQFRQDLAEDKWSQEYMELARSFFDGKAKDAVNTTMLALKHRIVAKDKNYIPFEVDKSFVVREISAANDIQQTINSYGMLQETKDKAPQPLIMTGLNNIIDRHIDQVAAVVGLAIPVRNFNKVWNVHSVEGVNTTVNKAIETNWGKEGKKFIEQVVQDIQGPRHNSQSNIYRAVKSGYIGATFLLNGSVVTKQIGSLFASTSMLRWRDPASMIGNLLYTMANYNKIAAEVDKYTASAWVRRQGMSDAEVYTLITEGKKNPITKALNKLPAVFNPAKWITAMDSAVALSLWKYAKQDVKREHPELSGEELNRATASFYDSVIENTQSMTDVLHRPEIQKRSDLFSEAFGMFKTDLYQMSGQLQNAMGRFGENKSKENAKLLGRTVYSIAASAVWGQLMTAVFALLRYKVKPYRDDEEDDELTVESWLKRQSLALGGDLMGYILPLFGSEAVGFIENVIYGESDDLVDSLALSAINDLYSTAVNIASSLKDGEAPSIDDYKDLLTKSLQVFGVPAHNILRTIEAIHLHATDIANGEFFSFEAGREKTKGQSLYEAILRGDKDQTEKLKLEFKDEDAIDEAARSALRENDPRINEAAQARIDGDISKYKSIVMSITSEGHFSQDLVVGAINAEMSSFNSTVKKIIKAQETGDTEEHGKLIKELLDKGYSESIISDAIGEELKEMEGKDDDEDDETSIYKASDINAALENGDTSSALEVISDLVKVKTNNYIAEGKSKTEAEKNAKSSIRSSVTSYWKPLYLAAYKSKNNAEMTRIRKLLHATKLYDNVVETCQDWVKQSK